LPTGVALVDHAIERAFLASADEMGRKKTWLINLIGADIGEARAFGLFLLSVHHKYLGHVHDCVATSAVETSGS
jgi:hypothetical protein